MTFGISVQGAHKGELVDALKDAIDSNSNAPQDGRIMRAAHALLEELPDLPPDGREYFASVSGHTEPPDGKGSSYISVGVTLGAAKQQPAGDAA